MQLRIISIDIIKPSSSTPNHLRTHKLSLIDQANLDIYYPLVLFYSGVDKSTSKASDHLKKSLSETLTHYYPFAGRVKDDYSIDCDDYGVTFIEAHVAMGISEVLKMPEIDTLEQLMPFNPHEKVSTHVNLGVQLNYFDCGGVAICLCFRHAIADATAAAYFVKNWAEVAMGSRGIQDVVYDCTSIFPPYDLMPSIHRSIIEKQSSTDCITKRFVFDGTKITALREKINNESNDHVASRLGTVSALIWGALIAIARESYDSTPPAVIVVDVRRRMNPPLPQHCIGNIIHSVTANWFADKAIGLTSLARSIRESVKMVNDDYVRKTCKGDSLLNFLRTSDEEIINNITKLKMFAISGLGGLPFYETDFGWGKPTWVSTPMRLYNCVVLSNTRDGQGVEAWMGLSKNHMAKFEQDPGILAHASFNQLVLSKSKL